MEQKRKAVLVLLFLSPAFGELVTGSTAPLVFFGPLFVLYLGLYGAAVLLIREFLVRFNKGGASLLALGLGYGIYEEALVVHSWSDSVSTNARLIGAYGQFAGINAVWAVWVSPWLAVVAIAMPLLVVDLLYPELRGKPLLGKPQMVACFAGGAAVFAIANGAPSAGLPDAAVLALAALLVAGCVAAAYYLPRELLRPASAAAIGSPWPSLLLGTVWAALQFSLSGLGSAAGLHPALAVALIAAGWVIGFMALRARLDATEWRHHLFLFFAGVMTWFALRDILSPGGPVGLRAVGAVYLLWAFRIHRRLWPSVGGAPGPAEADPTTATPMAPLDPANAASVAPDPGAAPPAP